MMRIETEHYTFELTEPTGRDGRQLWRQAAALIAQSGWVTPLADGDPAERVARVDRFVFYLAGHQHGEQLLRATLCGGTVTPRDSGEPEPITPKWLDKVPLTHSKEPYDALFQAWVDLGFFGDGLKKASAAGQRLANREIPTSE
jgi:hypothetical protein